MPKIQFKGHVLPEQYKVSIQGGPALHIENARLGLTTAIQFAVKDNRIILDCEVNQIDESALTHVLIRAQNTIDTAVNLLTFATGVGHAAILDTIHLPDGTAHNIIPEDREIAALSTSLKSGKDMADALKICLVDPCLSLALRDICDAIKGGVTPEINFARAIETIRQHFVPAGEFRDAGWEPMRAALNASRSYITAITSLSRGPRHGDYYEAEPSKVRETGVRAWTLMNRFLEYRKRGNQPLPLSEFPLMD